MDSSGISSFDGSTLASPFRVNTSQSRFHPFLESEKTRLREESTRIANLCETLSTKQLQSHFPHIVDDIFGLNGKPGFNLRDVTYNGFPFEYDLIFKLLHPQHGPLFGTIYKLVADGSCVFEFPISELPLAVQQEIKFGSSCHFYTSKLKLNFDTMAKDVLILNAFEYYIFYFMWYIVKPSKMSRVYNYGKYPKIVTECVSVRLCKEYISAFLPCDGLPAMQTCVFPLRAQMPKSRPPKKPTFLKKEIVNQMIESPIDTARPDDALTDIWRSYVFTITAIDFLIGIPFYYEKQFEDFNLPPLDNIIIIEYLIQHLHIFMYHSRDISDNRSEFKKLVLPLSQSRIYNFLKLMIIRWPNDGSYHVILEPWLIYVQPWCFTSPSSNLTNIIARDIDDKWLNFVANNFLFYTYLLQLILHRFKNLSFSSIENVLILEKILKLYTNTNLGNVIEDLEMVLCKSPQDSKTKYTETVRSHIIFVEGINFNFIPLFSVEFSHEMATFVHSIACYLGGLTNKTVSTNSSSSWNVLKWLKSTPRNDPYDLDTIKHLSNTRQLLMSLFRITATSFEVLDSTDETMDEHNLSSSPRVRKSNLIKQAKYTGDPDLMPIQSFEVGWLVRLLYCVSLQLNSKYGDVFDYWYTSDTFVSRVARQFLQAPMSVQNGQTTVELPARLSLRPLSHRLIYVYSSFCILLCYFLNIPILLCLVYFLFAFSIFVLTKATFNYE